MICRSSSVVELAVFDALDTLEGVIELGLSELAVLVVVALLHGQENVVLAVGRSQAHLQAQVSVGLVEALSLEVSGPEVVVMVEHMLDLVGKHRVVDGWLPSLGVVDSVVSRHASEASVALLPSVVGVRLDEALSLGSLPAAFAARAGRGAATASAFVVFVVSVEDAMMAFLMDWLSRHWTIVRYYCLRVSVGTWLSHVLRMAVVSMPGVFSCTFVSHFS